MAAGVVAVLLALAMSATPSAALGGQFTISPGSGPVGTVVTVSGTGCSPGFSVTSSDYVRVVATDVTVKSFQVDASGAWSGTITMDNAGLIGLVVITATCHTNGIPSLTTLYPIRSFDVTAPPAPSTTTTTQAPTTTTTVPATTTTAGSGGSGATTTTAPPAPTTTTDVGGAGPTTTVGTNGGPGGDGSTGTGSGGTGSSGTGSDGDGSSGSGSDGDGSSGTGSGGTGSSGSGSNGTGSSGSGSNGSGSNGTGSSGNGSNGSGSSGNGATGNGSAGGGSVGGDQSSGFSDGANGSSGDAAADGAGSETVEGSAERNVENGDVDDEVALAVATAPASLSDLTMGESADDGVGWLRWLLAAIALAIGIAAVVKRQAIARLIG
jgi:hypothetical protein